MLRKKKYDIQDEEESDGNTIYSKSVRESLLEDDELNPFEDAFMNGYETA